MGQSGLYIICAVIALLGLGIFFRAYHYGNQSMNRIGKDKQAGSDTPPSQDVQSSDQ